MWGYNQLNGDLIINEEEAKIVRFIFDLYVQGKGFRLILDELISQRILNRNGKPFSLTTLKRMIRNEKYKGQLICGKNHKNFYTKDIEIVPNSDWYIHNDRIPAIIDKEIWEKANEILNKKRKNLSIDEKSKIAGYFNGSFPLSGKIKCALCGGSFYHKSYITKVNKLKVEVWQCKRYTMYGKVEDFGCSNINVRVEDLNEIIRKFAYNIWDNKNDTFNNVLYAINNSLEDSSNNSKIDSLNRERGKLTIKKDKLLDLFSDDIITKAEFKIKNDEINNNINSLDKQIMQLREELLLKENKIDRLKRITDFLNIEFADKNGITDDFFEVMVDNIVVYPNRTIDLTINGNTFSGLSIPKPKRMRKYE